MNKIIKSATLINFEGSYNPFQLRPSFFHSSPFLERKRRTHWESGGNYTKGPRKEYNRFRKQHSKEALLRNVSSIAEQFFQDWKYDHDEQEASSKKKNEWFEFRQGSGPNGNKGERLKNGGSKEWMRREFQFCEDDMDNNGYETIFRAAFGGNPNWSWSFTFEEPERAYSYSYSKNQRNKRYWEHFSEDEYESEESYNSSRGDQTSDRLALGLSKSGPLNLQQVKTAYRACALKWHPDRHQGSSKAVAEEKFKKCSSAYQSLCDKLVQN